MGDDHVRPSAAPANLLTAVGIRRLGAGGRKSRRGGGRCWAGPHACDRTDRVRRQFRRRTISLSPPAIARARCASLAIQLPPLALGTAPFPAPSPPHAHPRAVRHTRRWGVGGEPCLPVAVAADHRNGGEQRPGLGVRAGRRQRPRPSATVHRCSVRGQGEAGGSGTPLAAAPGPDLGGRRGGRCAADPRLEALKARLQHRV